MSIRVRLLASGVFALVASTPLLLSVSAFAETGKLIEISPAEAPGATSAPATPVAPAPTISAVAEPNPGPSYSNPWLLADPAGQTAFTLDRNHFEGELGIQPFENRLLYGSHAAILSMSYGLLDTLTITAGDSLLAGGAGMPIFGLKWNFLNSGAWSFAVNPWIGVPVGSHSDFGATESPKAAELSASDVLSESSKLHFSFAAGVSPQSEGIDSIDLEDLTNKVYRFTAVWEKRLHRNHGFSLWLAPEYVATTAVDSWSSDSFSNQYSTRYMDVLCGVAYQYFHDGFGFQIGIESGPTWSKYAYTESGPFESNANNYGYSSFSVFGRTQATVLVMVRQ